MPSESATATGAIGEPQVEMKAARRPLEGFEDVQVERHRRRDDFKPSRLLDT